MRENRKAVILNNFKKEELLKVDYLYEERLIDFKEYNRRVALIIEAFESRIMATLEKHVSPNNREK